MKTKKLETYGIKINFGILILIGIIGLLLITIISLFTWTINFNNNCVIAEEDINTQFSNIATEYQRRADLYITTASTIQGFNQYQYNTLVDTIKARSNAFTGNQAKDIENMNQLDGLFARLMVLFEQYPQIQGMPMYQEFINNQKETENRINVARTDYNSIVRQYNIYINKFPNIFLKGMFSKQDKEYFKNKEGTEEVPKINLEIKR